MKCEICGRSDFLKDNGLFVCQGCGTKYSLEDARKLFTAEKITTGHEVEAQNESSILDQESFETDTISSGCNLTFDQHTHIDRAHIEDMLNNSSTETNGTYILIDEAINGQKKSTVTNKRFIIVLISLIVICGLAVLVSLLTNKSKQGIPSDSLPTQTKARQSEIDMVQIGQTVLFGSYEQDENHIGSESIEWIVIGKDDYGVNLISKMIIDLQRYNIEKKDVVWTNCNLRKWLNDSFWNKAFSAEEKNTMMKWSYFDTDKKELKDYVYCLSVDEVTSLWPTAKDRIATVTDYVYSLPDYTNTTKEGQWWLRSDSHYSGIIRTVNDVYSSGEIGVDNFRSLTVGVRPCIYVSYSAMKSEHLDNEDNTSNELTYIIKNSLPVYHIGKEDSVFYHHLVCKCTTDNGDNIYVYMTNDEYKEYFDSTAKVQQKGYLKYEEKMFDPMMQISGEKYDAFRLDPDIATTLGIKTLLVFIPPDAKK